MICVRGMGWRLRRLCIEVRLRIAMLLGFGRMRDGLTCSFGGLALVCFFWGRSQVKRWYWCSLRGSGTTGKERERERSPFSDLHFPTTIQTANEAERCSNDTGILSSLPTTTPISLIALQFPSSSRRTITKPRTRRRKETHSLTQSPDSKNDEAPPAVSRYSTDKRP
jgi:hypothetical protein